MPPAWSDLTRSLVRLAFQEDLGAPPRDLTTELLPRQAVQGDLRLRGGGVICGLDLLPLLIEELRTILGADVSLLADYRAADGDQRSAGALVARLSGDLRGVLALERTALNFIGRLSGVATLTRDYVLEARRGNPSVQVLDTRKTTPGWREMERHAVRCGGGANHRFGLHDAILLKDNHLTAAPADRLAAWLIELFARPRSPATFVEVEVDSLAQFREVARVAGVDIVLLDNFGLDDLAAAVRLRDELGLRGRLELEASGGVELATIRKIAETGVERISVGALTHSAVSLDVGLDVVSDIDVISDSVE